MVIKITIEDGELYLEDGSEWGDFVSFSEYDTERIYKFLKKHFEVKNGKQ